MQDRVAMLIHDSGRLLLVHRIKDGRDYHVLPGGTVEDGETLEIACLREALEETGLTVVLGEKLCTLVNQGRVEHYFRVARFEGELHLGGPEQDRQCEANQYRLEWVPLDQLDAIHLMPEAVRQLCRESIKAETA